jgi:hypothetical protein
MALHDHAAEVRRAAHEAYSRSKRQTVTVAQTAYCASTLRARLADRNGASSRKAIEPPDIFEVEFSDGQGRTYAQLALKENQLLVLHYQPQQAA